MCCAVLDCQIQQIWTYLAWYRANLLFFLNHAQPFHISLNIAWLIINRREGGRWHNNNTETFTFTCSTWKSQNDTTRYLIFVSAVCSPFPVSTWCSCAQSSSIKKCFSQFGVEELYWPAQSPDLNPIQHLWDELDCEPDLITQHQCWTSLMLLAEWGANPGSRFNICWKAWNQKSGGRYCSRYRGNICMSTHFWPCGVSTVKHSCMIFMHHRFGLWYQTTSFAHKLFIIWGLSAGFSKIQSNETGLWYKQKCAISVQHRHLLVKTTKPVAVIFILEIIFIVHKCGNLSSASQVG